MRFVNQYVIRLFCKSFVVDSVKSVIGVFLFVCLVLGVCVCFLGVFCLFFFFLFSYHPFSFPYYLVVTISLSLSFMLPPPSQQYITPKHKTVPITQALWKIERIILLNLEDLSVLWQYILDRTF